MIFKRKTRILYLQLSNPKTKTLGGSFYSLLNMVTGLKKGKYYITVAFYYKNSIMKKLSSKGIETIVLPYHKNIFIENIIIKVIKRLSNKDIKKFNNSERIEHIGNKKYVMYVLSLLKDYYISLLNSIAIIKEIKKNKFDIIHTNSGINIDRSAIIAGILTRKRIVCHLRNIPRFSFFDKILSKYIHQFIAVSNAVRSHYHEKLEIPLEKITLIYNSIDFSESIYKNKENLNSKQTKTGRIPFNVGIIGRIVRWKGHKDFLNSAKLLILYDPSIRFKIVGKGPLKQDMIDMVYKLKLDKHVSFYNYINNKYDIYSDLDVVVVPSIRPDPFPRVVIEAMSFGIPVVTTNIGGAKEIVENGKTGFLVEPESPEQMADIILKLKLDQELRVKIGEKGRNLMMEHFNNNVLMAKINGVYNKLML